MAATVIGLGHRRRVGKDTLGQILVEEHGFMRLAFADALKSVVDAMRPYLDHEIRYAISELGMEEAKASSAPVRELLICLGSTIRTRVAADAWTLAVAQRIDENPSGRYVVTDVRYPNEVRLIRERGGYLVRVDRKAAIVSQDPADSALEGFDQWDAVVANDLTVDDLRERAADIVRATTLSGAVPAAHPALAG